MGSTSASAHCCPIPSLLISHSCIIALLSPYLLTAKHLLSLLFPQSVLILHTCLSSIDHQVNSHDLYISIAVSSHGGVSFMGHGSCSEMERGAALLCRRPEGCGREKRIQRHPMGGPHVCRLLDWNRNLGRLFQLTVPVAEVAHRDNPSRAPSWLTSPTPVISL